MSCRASLRQQGRETPHGIGQVALLPHGDDGLTRRLPDREAFVALTEFVQLRADGVVQFIHTLAHRSAVDWSREPRRTAELVDLFGGGQREPGVDDPTAKSVARILINATGSDELHDVVHDRFCGLRDTVSRSNGGASEGVGRCGGRARSVARSVG